MKLVAMWNLLIVAFVVTAGVSDVLRRRIPRSLCVAGFIVGLLYHWRSGDAVMALLAAVLAFAVGLLFFTLGALGGGDVKLMTALGAMLGLEPWLRAMQIAIFAAGVIAIVQMVRYGRVRQTFRNIGSIFRNFARAGVTAHPEINVRNPALIRSPFAVAIAVGVLLAMAHK